MSSILLTPSSPIKDQIHLKLSGSKSISQRVLIIHYLMNNNSHINNLSDSNDTKILKDCLSSSESVLNVYNSGTTLRFLLSLLSLKGHGAVLTGCSSLFNRPINKLIEYLNCLGGDIIKKNNHIYIRKSRLIGGDIYLKHMKTSQFISSILLISPYLKGGLNMYNFHNVLSESYVQMTIEVMKKCGVNVIQKNGCIIVPEDKYNTPFDYIESDWTSVSYLFLSFLFSNLNKLTISFFYKKTIQSDQIIVYLFDLLGLNSTFLNDKLILTKSNNSFFPKKIEWNFANFPDISLTIIIACFGLGIELVATGLDTLPYKESHRIKSIYNELLKFNCIVETDDHSFINIKPINIINKNQIIDIETYFDHRIALAFSPLTLLGFNLKIQNPNVINKSYASFFNDLTKFGVGINNLRIK